MIKIVDLPLFSLEDFRCRWRLARVAAVEKNLQDPAQSGLLNMEELEKFELDLLRKIESNEIKEKILRSVFDHSRKLGISLVRYLKHSFEISDLADVLPESGLPCFIGKWEPHNQAFLLKREGCNMNSKKDPFICDYWREALDGLVMGVGVDERLARHRSMGHGDTDCQDILFLDSDTKTNVSVQGRWGSLPDDLLRTMSEQTKNLEQKGYHLMVHGYSEGQIFYELKAKNSSQCGPGERMMANHFEAQVLQTFPNLKLAEISPQSVLDHKQSH